MARKTAKGKTGQRRKKARSGKAAAVKARPRRSLADRAAMAGALAQWSPAEVEEAFRRFQRVEPEPESELEHVDPYTLLIAVVLSAQATDAGVNRATPALLAVAY